MDQQSLANNAMASPWVNQSNSSWAPDEDKLFKSFEGPEQTGQQEGLTTSFQQDDQESNPFVWRKQHYDNRSNPPDLKSDSVFLLHNFAYLSRKQKFLVQRRAAKELPPQQFHVLNEYRNEELLVKRNLKRKFKELGKHPSGTQFERSLEQQLEELREERYIIIVMLVLLKRLQ